MLHLNIFFFFNDPATTEIYTLSLHDALPILRHRRVVAVVEQVGDHQVCAGRRHSTGLEAARRDLAEPLLEAVAEQTSRRSEEHTSELQSRQYLVCRLLLEKKKDRMKNSGRLR